MHYLLNTRKFLKYGSFLLTGRSYTDTCCYHIKKQEVVIDGSSLCIHCKASLKKLSKTGIVRRMHICGYMLTCVNSSAIDRLVTEEIMNILL